MPLEMMPVKNALVISSLMLLVACDSVGAQEVTEREAKAALALATQRCESIKKEPTGKQVIRNMQEASAGGSRFDMQDLSKKIVINLSKIIAIDLCRQMIAGDESCRLLRLGIPLKTAASRGSSYAESLMGAPAPPEDLATLSDRTANYLNAMCEALR